jgi:hypothetical protein
MSLFNDEEKEIAVLNKIQAQLGFILTRLDKIEATLGTVATTSRVDKLESYLTGVASAAQKTAIFVEGEINAELGSIRDLVTTIVDKVGKPGPATGAEFVFGKPVPQR